MGEMEPDVLAKIACSCVMSIMFVGLELWEEAAEETLDEEVEDAGEDEVEDDPPAVPAATAFSHIICARASAFFSASTAATLFFFSRKEGGRARFLVFLTWLGGFDPTSKSWTREVRSSSMLPTNVCKCVNDWRMALMKHVLPRLVKPTCPGTKLGETGSGG